LHGGAVRCGDVVAGKLEERAAAKFDRRRGAEGDDTSEKLPRGDHAATSDAKGRPAVQHDTAENGHGGGVGGAGGAERRLVHGDGRGPRRQVKPALDEDRPSDSMTTRLHLSKQGSVRRDDEDELLRAFFLDEAPSYVKNQGGLGAEPPEKKWVLNAPDDACCTFAALEVGFFFDAKLRF